MSKVTLDYIFKISSSFWYSFTYFEGLPSYFKSN
jgi:hypothetical protein